MISRDGSLSEKHERYYSFADNQCSWCVVELLNKRLTESSDMLLTVNTHNQIVCNLKLHEILSRQSCDYHWSFFVK